MTESIFSCLFILPHENKIRFVSEEPFCIFQLSFGHLSFPFRVDKFPEPADNDSDTMFGFLIPMQIVRLV